MGFANWSIGYAKKLFVAISNPNNLSEWYSDPELPFVSEKIHPFKKLHSMKSPILPVATLLGLLAVPAFAQATL